ncbi:1,2-phenylacetyl-CoA epoxidase subunit PaaD [Solwaraspora sp. WMMB335]|uniref:1,2-phenylacetyl-CoA epoxidase subunit PaaD n=1 Tax=Solwaraspora sp. WMMB335 TaxID=3404118 RepID=UPI003B93BADB
MLTIDDLGILRAVEVDERTGAVRVTITPTYTGCPAMDVIRADIRAALHRAGFADVTLDTVLAPAWSTDWISKTGRRKLADAGIAPPERTGSGQAADDADHGGGRPPGRLPSDSAAKPVPVPVALTVRCPACGSPRTEQLSRFGATACKALWRCRDCAEPFEQIKAL